MLKRLEVRGGTFLVLAGLLFACGGAQKPAGEASAPTASVQAAPPASSPTPDLAPSVAASAQPVEPTPEMKFARGGVNLFLALVEWGPPSHPFMNLLRKELGKLPETERQQVDDAICDGQRCDKMTPPGLCSALADYFMAASQGTAKAAVPLPLLEAAKKVRMSDGTTLYQHLVDAEKTDLDGMRKRLSKSVGAGGLG